VSLNELPELTNVLKGRRVCMPSPGCHQQETIVNATLKKQLESAWIKVDRSKTYYRTCEHSDTLILIGSNPQVVLCP